MFSGLIQDIRYALRGFWKAPLFSVIAVLSVALGIGANAAIFSLMDQMLLRPLPVAHPERLVMLDLPGGGIGYAFNDFAFSNTMFRSLRAQNQTFEELFAQFNDSANLSFRGRSETVPVGIVSGNFFKAIGVSAALGRTIDTTDDTKKNGHPVVVLNYGYFARRFGADPNIVGQNLRINSQLYQVIGVTPKGFSGLEMDNVASIYVPLAQKTQITTTWDGMEDPNFYFLHVYGLLKQGVDRTAAKANLDSLVSPLIEDEMKAHPSISAKGKARFRAKRFKLIPAGTPLIGERKTIEKALYLLLGVVGLVLLIACANVANLLLARASARVKEVAVRMALGAGRARLARQSLVESLILGLSGGALGLILSIWILDAILALYHSGATGELFLNSQPDWRIAAFCFAASLLTGLLFGIAPALRGAGFAIVETLKENTGAIVTHGTQGWLRRALVVAQVTISLVLLVAAGLFAKSLLNLRNADPGFKANYLLTFKIDASLNGYEKSRAVSFLDRFRNEIATLPGVNDVTVASAGLLENAVNQATMSIEGHPRREGVNTNSRINSVGPGFFRSLGFPLLMGREFNAGDQANSQKVAVHANMREEKPSRFVYTPYTQNESIQGMTFYVRSERDSEQLAGEVRASLRRIDENLAMFRVQTMASTIENSLQVERLLSMLCSAFGLLATLLAAIGLYGVMAYNVARRTREIGIRLALGAEKSTVMSMVMRDVGSMLAIGLFIGIPLAVALGRFVESQLFGLKGWDPLILTGASICLGIVAILAGAIPAWRAVNVNPAIALRGD
ncbi:MAG: ABC transporter permease [Acidobacteria bacterium]|nr:ABC transporter permease [Acidobacteriota bacterium]